MLNEEFIRELMSKGAELVLYDIIFNEEHFTGTIGPFKMDFNGILDQRHSRAIAQSIAECEEGATKTHAGALVGEIGIAFFEKFSKAVNEGIVKKYDLAACNKGGGACHEYILHFTEEKIYAEYSLQEILQHCRETNCEKRDTCPTHIAYDRELLKT